MDGQRMHAPLRSVIFAFGKGGLRLQTLERATVPTASP